MISLSIYFSGPVTTTGAFFYLWVVLGSAYYFSRSKVVVQLLIVAAGYALALALKPHAPGMVQAWIVAVGTLTRPRRCSWSRASTSSGWSAGWPRPRTPTRSPGCSTAAASTAQLELELERAARCGHDVSLLIGDLDHFKRVNDRFGHQSGDEVLLQVGEVLRRRARRIDCVARVGGEEFALVIPNTDARRAYVRRRAAAPPRPRGVGRRHPAHDQLRDRLLSERLRLGRAPAALRRQVAVRREGARARPDRDLQPRGRRRLRAGAGGRRASGGANLATVLTLAEALDLRDRRTARHSETVGRYAEGMAKQLGFPPDRVERIRLAGILHDIGKIGVADSILLQARSAQRRGVGRDRNHPEIGARMLSGPGFGDLAGLGPRPPRAARRRRLPVRPDRRRDPARGADHRGRRRVRGDVADRPYRRGRPVDEALAELRRCGGTQFDPEVVAALTAHLDAQDGMADEAAEVAESAVSA